MFDYNNNLLLGAKVIAICYLFSILFTANCLQCGTKKDNLPKKDQCSAFYDCSSGSPELKLCPDGQFYNCYEQKCSSRTYRSCCPMDTGKY